MSPVPGGTNTPSAAASSVEQTVRRSGLHPSTVDSDGTGYLLWAACYGLPMAHQFPAATDMFLALLSLLVDRMGINVDQRPPQRDGGGSRNPLQYVAKAGSPRAVQAMLNRGAKVNLRDDEGWTALMAVCMKDDKRPGEGGPTDEDRLETARLLVRHGAEVDARNTLGCTALHIACGGLHVPLVQFLLSCGADRTIRSFAGDSMIGWVGGISNDDPALAEQCLELLSAADDLTTSEDTKVVNFDKLMDDVLVPAHNRMGSKPRALEIREDVAQRATQERDILKALLGHVGLDTTVLTRRFSADDGNWYGELHEKLSAILPSSFTKVYHRDNLPTKEEISLVASCDGNARRAASTTKNGSRTIDQDILFRVAFTGWRQRGLVSRRMMEQFKKMVVDAAQHCIGYAVPTDCVLEKIGSHGPLVEVGSGTGYWTAALQGRGVDIVAYDAHPPTAEHNEFFDHAFTDVCKGRGDSIFENGEEGMMLSRRAMLMIWPNNPDSEDNPQFNDGTTCYPPVWDADCLSSYIRAGGSTVIYVGEREENIKVEPGAPPDCGASSSRRFQEMLQNHFRLVEQIECPQWFLHEDDVTVWKRKEL